MNLVIWVTFKFQIYQNSKFSVSEYAINDIFGPFEFAKMWFHVKSAWRWNYQISTKSNLNFTFWKFLEHSVLREIDFTKKLLKCLLFCRLSKGSFYMPKRLDLWSSTILSWLPIWLIVSLYLKVPLVSTLELVLLNRCSLVWTSSLSNYKSHSEGIHRIIGTFWFNFSNLIICFNFHPNFICRPRINKLNSVKDSEQKASGNYFFLEDE